MRVRGRVQVGGRAASKNSVPMAPAARRLDVVVSLTTIPGRVKHLWPVLKRLLYEQTCPPARVIVHLPRRYANPALGTVDVVPDAWVDAAPLLEVNRACDDLGPATKLVGLAATDVDARDVVVLYVDDDHLYPRDFVEVHLQAHVRGQTHVWCGRGDVLLSDGGRESVSGADHSAPAVHLPCGVFGVSVHNVDLAALDQHVRSLPKELLFSDDLVFGNAFAAQGIHVRVLRHRVLPYILQHSSDEHALHNGKRDECQGATTERYRRGLDVLNDRLALRPYHRCKTWYVKQRVEKRSDTLTVCDRAEPGCDVLGLDWLVGVGEAQLLSAALSMSVDLGYAFVAVMASAGTAHHGDHYAETLTALRAFAEKCASVAAVHGGVHAASSDPDVVRIVKGFPARGGWLTTADKLKRALALSPSNAAEGFRLAGMTLYATCPRRRASVERYNDGVNVGPPNPAQIKVWLPDDVTVASLTDAAYPKDISGVACYDHVLRSVFPRCTRRVAGARVVVADNHAVLRVSADTLAVLVHHGVAATHLERDPNWPGARLAEMQRKMLRARSPANTAVVSCSEFCKTEFARHYGGAYTRFPCRVVPHTSALPQQRWERRDAPAGRPVVVGDWRLPHKGSDALSDIEALAPEFEFRQMRVAPPAPFDADEFSRRKVAFYRDADVALVLSSHEGNSYFLLDAMQMDLVCVSTDVGLAPDMPHCAVVPWQASASEVVAAVRKAWAERLSPGTVSGACLEQYGRLGYAAAMADVVLELSLVVSLKPRARGLLRAR